MSGPVTALVLAGRRTGEVDTVAMEAGVRCKAFAKIGGTPMVERVLSALQAVPEIGAIFIVLPDDVAAEEEAPHLAALLRQGIVTRLSAATSPALSVVAALDHLPPSLPLLVTTADHALLTPAMLRLFLGGAAGADAAAAVVPLGIVLQKYPDTRRTRLAFRDGAYKGANLFYFSSGTPARQAATFWRRLEDMRKQPWRMALTLGPVFLLRYVFRQLTLAGAVSHLGRLAGIVFGAVKLPIAEAAFDVDNVADLGTIRRIASEL